jgi:hypothetical protein
MDWTRLRSSSEIGWSEGRNEIIAETIGGTFMVDIVVYGNLVLGHYMRVYLITKEIR